MNTQQIDKRLYFEPRYSNGDNKRILWRYVTCGYIGMYRWEIRSNGIYPVMYVKLPKNHPLRAISDSNYLDHFIQEPNITYWDGETVGWDFGHVGDYRHGETNTEGVEIHTVTELKRLLKAIIKRCQEIENDPEAIKEIEYAVEQIRYDQEERNRRFQDDDDYPDDYYDNEGIYNESKNYSKMSKKNTIRLTESKLKNLISESVRKVMNEASQEDMRFFDNTDNRNEARESIMNHINQVTDEYSLSIEDLRFILNSLNKWIQSHDSFM